MPIPEKYKENKFTHTPKGQWIAIASHPKPLQKNNINWNDINWWEVYHDDTLNELEKQVSCSNQNLKIALARFQEAQAIAQVSRSALYPNIQSIDNASRQHVPSALLTNTQSSELTYNSFYIGAQLTYELDAWGRVRNAVIASDSLARASGYDLDAINLSLHAELANHYFQLRADDEAQTVLDDTVSAYKKVLYLTRKRYKGGASPAYDVYQAETQLKNAQTQATDNRLNRAQLEHAIAVLVGAVPANFTLQKKQYKPPLVMISTEIPSTLLTHRPDIASAMEQIRSANASVGVARAAFFPQFNLTTLAATNSSQLSSLFSASSLFWSLGPSTTLALLQPLVSQVIFDGYNLQGLLKKAKANYFETVSSYRQTVLTAFQQVEDGLVAIRRLDEELKTQTAATHAAYKALYQANQRYKGGIATFLDVIYTENEALQSKLALINIHTRRQIASVQLIKALGGGWSIPQIITDLSEWEGLHCPDRSHHRKCHVKQGGFIR